MQKSKIPWCDATWNVTAGCSKCSPGCLHCWAERMSYRLACMNHHKGNYTKVGNIEGKWNGNVICDESILDKPLHWHKPRRIFVCSMSDLFHPKVPFEFIDKVFAAATLCPQHTFLMLTKRIDRALEYVLQEPRGHIDHAITDGLTHFVGRGKKYAGKGLTKHLRNKNYLWPLNNVHLGVSICNQKELDKKMPIALQIPGFDWISFEPLLSDIKMPLPCKKSVFWDGLKWVVVGAESGPSARYCPIENIRGIVEQCKAASVPVFVKQIHLNGKAKAIKDMSQFPKDLRIQQYPKGS